MYDIRKWRVKKKLEKKKKNALKYYDKFLKQSEKQNRKKW